MDGLPCGASTWLWNWERRSPSSGPTARASPLCCFTSTACSGAKATSQSWDEGFTRRTAQNSRRSAPSSADDQLFSPTVYEDVAFGPIYMGLPRDEVGRRVEESLKQVGLDGYGDRMPHHLSGGEKKRVAIATVLSMRPEILALDEPSAGLDPRSRRGLIKLLGDLKQTILITTHDMHMVREIFPRTIIMDAGAVVADGQTEAILSDEALLEAHGLALP